MAPRCARLTIDIPDENRTNIIIKLQVIRKVKFIEHLFINEEQFGKQIRICLADTSSVSIVSRASF